MKSSAQSDNTVSKFKCEESSPSKLTQSEKLQTSGVLSIDSIRLLQPQLQFDVNAQSTKLKPPKQWNSRRYRRRGFSESRDEDFIEANYTNTKLIRNLQKSQEVAKPVLKGEQCHKKESAVQAGSNVAVEKCEHVQSLEKSEKLEAQNKTFAEDFISPFGKMQPSQIIDIKTENCLQNYVIDDTSSCMTSSRSFSRPSQELLKEGLTDDLGSQISSKKRTRSTHAAEKRILSRKSKESNAGVGLGKRELEPMSPAIEGLKRVNEKGPLETQEKEVNTKFLVVFVDPNQNKKHLQKWVYNLDRFGSLKDGLVRKFRDSVVQLRNNKDMTEYVEDRLEMLDEYMKRNNIQPSREDVPKKTTKRVRPSRVKGAQKRGRNQARAKMQKKGSNVRKKKNAQVGGKSKANRRGSRTKRKEPNEKEAKVGKGRKRKGGRTRAKKAKAKEEETVGERDKFSKGILVEYSSREESGIMVESKSKTADVSKAKRKVTKKKRKNNWTTKKPKRQKKAPKSYKIEDENIILEQVNGESARSKQSDTRYSKKQNKFRQQRKKRRGAFLSGPFDMTETVKACPSAKRRAMKGLYESGALGKHVEDVEEKVSVVTDDKEVEVKEEKAGREESSFDGIVEKWIHNQLPEYVESIQQKYKEAPVIKKVEAEQQLDLLIEFTRQFAKKLQISIEKDQLKIN